MSRNKSQESFPLSKIVGPTLVLAVFGLALWIANTRWFIIREIECIVQDQSAPDICSQLDFLKNKSLLFSDLEHTGLYQDLIKNDQGQVFQTKLVERQLPNKMIVHLVKEEPSYQLIIEDKSYWINHQNYYGQNDPSLDLPKVELSSEHQQLVGKSQIDPTFNKKVITLLDHLRDYQVNFDRIYLNGEHSEIYLQDNTKLIFQLSQNSQTLAPKIKLISLQLGEIEDFLPHGMEQIDLRFDLPVIKTNKN